MPTYLLLFVIANCAFVYSHKKYPLILYIMFIEILPILMYTVSVIIEVVALVAYTQRVLSEQPQTI